MSDIEGTNLILAAMHLAERKLFSPKLVSCSFRLGEVIQRAGEKRQQIFFPCSGVGSVLAISSAGSNAAEAAEAVTIGREGVLGLAALAGSSESAQQYVCQAPMQGLRINAAVLRRLLPSAPQFSATILAYGQIQFMEAAQAVVCNAKHEAQRRLARWLLIMADRIGAPRYVLTHEFAALMLATRRATVTIAAGALQAEGLIDYRRGQLRILDRERLKLAACDCYRVITRAMRHFTRIHPPSPGRRRGT